MVILFCITSVLIFVKKVRLLYDADKVTGVTDKDGLPRLSSNKAHQITLVQSVMLKS